MSLTCLLNTYHKQQIKTHIIAAAAATTTTTNNNITKVSAYSMNPGLCFVSTWSLN